MTFTTVTFCYFESYKIHQNGAKTHVQNIKSQIKINNNCNPLYVCVRYNLILILDKSLAVSLTPQ